MTHKAMCQAPVKKNTHSVKHNLLHTQANVHYIPTTHFAQQFRPDQTRLLHSLIAAFLPRRES